MARLQRGKVFIEQVPEVGEIRELTRADLTHLTEKRPRTSIQTLRDNHHRIARALASGLSNHEVAATCGISYNRVNQLKDDPSFTDLVAHYRAIITAEWASQDTVVEYMRTNALKAMAQLSDKLDAASENNEFLPTRDLVSISELGLDRTGYGKVNKNINVNVDFASKLEEARKRSAGARSPQTIEATMVSLPSPQLAPESSNPARAPVPSFRRM